MNNYQVLSIIIVYALPETNIAPKKWWFPIEIFFSKGRCSGVVLVSGRVDMVHVPTPIEVG